MKKNNSQNNSCFKIMPELVSFCHITTEAVIGDYGFKLFQKVKTIIGDYNFMVKVKTGIGDYGFMLTEI